MAHQGGTSGAAQAGIRQPVCAETSSEASRLELVVADFWCVVTCALAVEEAIDADRR